MATRPKQKAGQGFETTEVKPRRLPGRGMRIRARVPARLGWLLLLTACEAPTSGPGSSPGPSTTPPSISQHPQDQTIAEAATATFTVEAAGAAPLAYSWTRNRTVIDGATEAAYTTPPAGPADDGAQFAVQVSNSAGTVTSNPATLTVITPPSIIQQPQDQTVSEAATATFTVGAAGTAPFAYSWTRNDTIIDGATEATYTTPPARHADDGAQYGVQVSNSAGTATSDAATLRVTLSPLESALNERFFERFGEPVPYPAYYDNVACGGPHVATTAYIKPSGRKSRLLSLYTSRDGATIITSATRLALTPAGTFAALVVLVGYPQTVDASNLSLWEAAQQQINANHASFASSRGWPTPIVSFANTNLLLNPSDVADPRSSMAVTNALTQQGYSTAGYDLLVSVNLDPGALEGGFAAGGTTPPFIYMGNFSAWTAPLTEAAFGMVARAVYHHEVAHIWGWPGTHDWSTCGTPGFNFVVPPVLFGWEDTNGDGVPEILSPAPYGRDQP